jgi:hypothetical protein
MISSNQFHKIEFNKTEPHKLQFIKTEPEFNLVIDKISITLNDPDNSMVQSGIDRIIGLIRTGKIQGRIQSSGPYKTRFVIDIDGTDRFIPERLLIHAAPKLHGIGSYRAEFNPDKIGLDGVKQVFDILGVLIGSDGPSFLMTEKSPDSILRSI